MMLVYSGTQKSIIHILDDIAKLIKTSGYKSSCLFQCLVFSHCSLRCLVSTCSSVAKLDLKVRTNLELYLFIKQTFIQQN